MSFKESLFVPLNFTPDLKPNYERSLRRGYRVLRGRRGSQRLRGLRSANWTSTDI